MKIIIAESQKESLKNSLIKLINRSGFNAGVKAVGSFDILVNILGKETLYSILVQHGFDPINKVKIITSSIFVPRNFFDRISHSGINNLLNKYGPMFLLMIDNEYYIYQDQGKENLFFGEFDGVIPEETFQNSVLYPRGLSGINIGKVIDLYYTEED